MHWANKLSSSSLLVSTLLAIVSLLLFIGWFETLEAAEADSDLPESWGRGKWDREWWTEAFEELLCASLFKLTGCRGLLGSVGENKRYR